MSIRNWQVQQESLSCPHLWARCGLSLVLEFDPLFSSAGNPFLSCTGFSKCVVGWYSPLASQNVVCDCFSRCSQILLYIETGPKNKQNNYWIFPPLMPKKKKKNRFHTLWGKLSRWKYFHKTENHLKLAQAVMSLHTLFNK